MTFGQKIKKLRNDKGLTQKDLSDELHVTFQTVSKWESGTNEPNIATIKELAKFFGCSYDYLLSDEEEEKEEETKEAVATASDEGESKTIIIHQKEAHVCEKCGRDIPEGDLVMEDICVVRPGKGRLAQYRKGYYHKACLEELHKEKEEQIRKEKAYQASIGAKKTFGWGIASGVVALAISLIIFIVNRDTVNVGLGILYSVLIGYSIFAMVYCIVSGSYIGDVFLWCAGLSIKFPGIIFSWDLGGFIFLVAMKVLFAVIGFLIGVFALIFAIVLSALLGGISFPFVLLHNTHTDYEDVL